jgi:hypothetical protein
MALWLVLYCGTNLEALKRVLWEDFTAGIVAYKKEESQENAERLWQAYEKILDASPKEVAQTWKEGATRQINDLYDNPENDNFENYSEAYFIDKIDKFFCRLPEKLQSKLKRRVEKSFRSSRP